MLESVISHWSSLASTGSNCKRKRQPRGRRFIVQSSTNLESVKMTAKVKARETEEVVVKLIEMTAMGFNIVGTTPLVPHSMSAHSKGMLLFPPPRKNATERATTMKHQPYTEFYEAAYKFTDDEARGTRLYMPAGAVKAAIKDVAIDLENAKKAQIARLTRVPGSKLPVYGIPDITTMVVRSSDIKRTPDIRTLPILRQWAIPRLTIEFVGSLIKEQSIANLLANSGIIIGIGDGRQQKGYFDYGSWRLALDDDEELVEIMAKGGIEAQDRALANPRVYDLETEQLLGWFTDEQKRRAASPPRAPKARGNGGAAKEEVANG